MAGMFLRARDRLPNGEQHDSRGSMPRGMTEKRTLPEREQQEKVARHENGENHKIGYRHSVGMCVDWHGGNAPQCRRSFRG